jgi:hypothetical protein
MDTRSNRLMSPLHKRKMEMMEKKEKGEEKVEEKVEVKEEVEQ